MENRMLFKATNGNRPRPDNSLDWGLTDDFQTVPWPFKNLLQLYFGASLSELLLEIFGFVLRQAFLDSLRSAVNEILSFFQTKTSEFFHQLHDLKFISARGFQYYVKVSFCFRSSSTTTSTSCRSSHYSSSCRFDAIGFF